MYTFGLGDDCDTNFLERVASAGRGFCSIIRDGGDVRGPVIQALAESMMVHVYGAKWGWQGEKLEQKDLRRDYLISSTRIFKKAAFENVAFKVFAEATAHSAGLDQTFTAADFVQVEDEANASALVKFGAGCLIRKKKQVDNEVKRLAIKY